MTAPDVSVVIATCNRASRLRDLLAALRAQTLDRARFEVVVVDDAAGDDTPAVLRDELRRGELALKVIRHEENRGSGVAREEGWRASSAPLVAFTDDDCVPDPEWLDAGLRAVAAHPGAIVQGRTDPIAEEMEALPPRSRPFTRTIRVHGPDPGFQTCNIFYPRELLERIGGFDHETYPRWPGEDSDLAWRAIAVGAGTHYADEARVRHAVNFLGPVGKLRHATRWDMKVYALRPEIRRATFFRYGVFWKRAHFYLAAALVAAILPRRRLVLPLRLALAYPYVRLVYSRASTDGALSLAPYYVVYDLVEAGTVLRSAIRYRTPMF